MVFFTRFIRFRYKMKVAGILLIILPFLWINTAFYHNNCAKVHAFNGYVYVDDGKNYIVGLADEEFIEDQIEIIERCVGKVHTLILLDYEDMSLLNEAIEKGLEFDSLYGAKYMKANEISKKHKFSIIATLKTRNGCFDFQQAPKFFCREKCINLDEKE